MWTIGLASAVAGTIEVPEEASTLGDALDQARPGDTIRLAEGDYEESVVVSRPVTIEGVQNVRIMPMQGNAITALADLEVRNVSIIGRGEASGIEAQGVGVEVLLEDVLFDLTYRDGDGGAVLTRSVDLEIRNCVFQGSVATRFGGAVAVFGGTLDIRGSTFALGQAMVAGGHVFSDDSTTFTTIASSVFATGSAADRGGAGYFKGGRVEVIESTFEGNSAQGGGALYLLTDVAVIDGCRFVSNSAEDAGAVAFRAQGGQVVRSTFCDNVAYGFGGGLRTASPGGATIENSVFIHNVGHTGGGVHVLEGDAVIRHSGFAANRTQVQGGHALSSVVGAEVFDTVFVDHPEGAPAISTAGGGVVDHCAWYGNVDDNNGYDEGPGQVYADPLLDVSADACNTLDFLPPRGSSLIGAAADGSDIGPFSGPETWPDGDEDGFISLLDCDDGDANAYPGAPEICDGIDNDCDGQIEDPCDEEVQPTDPEGVPADGDIPRGWFCSAGGFASHPWVVCAMVLVVLARREA